VGVVSAFVEVVGVYHADGGLVGELRYVIGRTFGTTHCALCDITHGAVAAKATWKQVCATSEVPIRVVHLNERSADEEAFTAGRTPCVIGRHTTGELVMLLDAVSLDACGGDVGAFEEALRGAIATVG
jgi:hypothetical protein